jgi:hypothetical protein
MSTERPPVVGIRFPLVVKARIQKYADAAGISFTAAVLVLCKQALDLDDKQTTGLNGGE